MWKKPYRTIVQENGTMRIFGNNHKIPFVYSYELTEKELKEFDYYENNEIQDVTFFRYRGNVYDLGEFQIIPSGMFPKEFDGYISDSFFSGILIHFCNNPKDDYDTDHIKAYTYICQKRIIK